MSSLGEALKTTGKPVEGGATAAAGLLTELTKVHNQAS